MRASKAHSPQRKEHCIVCIPSLLTHRQWVRRQRVNALTCCVTDLNFYQPFFYYRYIRPLSIELSKM